MSSRDKKLLIILVGILALGLTYYFVYRSAVKQTDELKAENDRLRARVEYLSALAEKAPEYERETTRMNNEIALVIDKFPSLLKIENRIMDVVSLEDNTNSFVSSFTVSDPVYVDTGYVAEDESLLNYQLFNVATDLIFDVDYDGFKSMVNYIRDSSDPMSVEFVNLSFNNTNGILSGSMEYNAFYLTGQEKAYQEADIPTILHGVDNIFGTIELPTVDEYNGGVTGASDALVGESE